MKEKLRNKKVVYTIIGIVSVLLVALAVTYAYWLVTKTQTNENVISSACLDISISGEKNDITLTNQFPMSDEDGMKLVPYEFTVTNNCNTSVDYQVALEATGTESNAITTSSLKVALNDSISLLSENATVDETIDGAYESRKLATGTLAATGNEGSTATYNLRIWIDKDAPISEMSKTFKSRISVTIGQGIENDVSENPYEEGTLAYSILSNAGGAGAISEIDVNVLDHRITSTGNQMIQTSSNYYYGTEYTYDETTGEYKISGTTILAKVTECRNGTKICGKYYKNGRELYEITDWNNSNGTNYVTANRIEFTTPFNAITTANEAGLYKTQDDLGDSYYFRGTPSNNYVQFGSYAANSEVNGTTYAEETPMYWRIVRINGDGTIRLVYDGTTKAENGTEHASDVGDSVFNSNSDNAKYVGYTYDDGNGTQVDSTIKGALDTWYDTHLKVNYGDKIADSIFCNDRSEAGYLYYDADFVEITDSNAAVYKDILYGAYQRLIRDKVPSLKCAKKDDRYTVNDTANGNGLLSNPVGLITADEDVLAGNMLKRRNESYYLYNGGSYWTSTPYSCNESDAGLYAWDVWGYGDLFYDYVDSNYGVRPVINLKADVEFTGDGSYETPYKIVTE